MKWIILVANATLLATLAQSFTVQREITSFEQFKMVYHKQYSAEEEPVRREIFNANLRWIEENKDKHGAVLDINEHADLTDEEFRLMFGTMNENTYAEMNKQTPVVSYPEEGASLPANFDWRQHAHLNSPVNQGQCGSCWAFATVATIEAAYAIHKKVNVKLSEQQLVDCDTPARGYVNHGCRGGYPNHAMDYVHREGLIEESVYPYIHKDEACEVNRLRSHKQYHVNGGHQLGFNTSDTSVMQALHEHGPVVVLIFATDNRFRFYKNGILRNVLPWHRSINHAVTLIGWGSDNGVDYWLIKNSWGTGWGEGGYVRVERHHGLMGINNYVCYPILN